MTRYTRVRLAPRGPFHFGGPRGGMEHSEVGLPADSLFSALCVTLGEAPAAKQWRHCWRGSPRPRHGLRRRSG